MRFTRWLSIAAVISTLSVTFSAMSEAATWRPISLTVDWPGTNTSKYNNAVGDFSDNAYPQNFILTDNINPPIQNGPYRTTISFYRDAAPNVAPPLIDTNARTINVSSIYAEGFYPAYDCDVNYASCDPRYPRIVWVGAIGWNFGPLDPVPYIVNNDGTLTATWAATNSPRSGYDGFGNNPVHFTFAPIPLPPAIFLFGSGIAALLWGRVKIAK
jgi:hypothetical protein